MKKLRRNEIKMKEENLTSLIKNTINKYQLIEKQDKIVVGVSGGPDSMCLLDNLKEIYIPKQIRLKQICPKQIRPNQTRNRWGRGGR